MMPTLPAIGMGTAGIGNLYRRVSDAEAEATIATALEQGFAYFDTAPHYGFGLAERRLGDALAALDPQGGARISTKVGRLLEPTGETGERHGFIDADPYEPRFDYSHDGVMRSFDASLGRLKRQRVDVLLAHDLGEMTHAAAHPGHLRDFLEGGYPAMRALRDTGAVAAIGIGVNEIAICEQLIEQVELDMILLAGRYTLLEQQALDRLLPRCAERGVRLIIGGPYNSGILAEAPDGPGHYDYARAPAEIVERVRRIAAICAAFEVPLPAAALAFPLAHDQVECVIPGLVGADQVTATARLAAVTIPAGLWSHPRDDGLLHPDAPVPSPERSLSPPPKLLLLHPDDNVLIAIAPIAAGDRVRIDSDWLRVPQAITVGHKVARRTLAAGEKVIRYGAPIGSMTQDATAGDHVHGHNMRSDYIAAHDRTAVQEGLNR